MTELSELDSCNILINLVNHCHLKWSMNRYKVSENYCMLHLYIMKLENVDLSLNSLFLVKTKKERRIMKLVYVGEKKMIWKSFG